MLCNDKDLVVQTAWKIFFHTHCKEDSGQVLTFALGGPVAEGAINPNLQTKLEMVSSLQPHPL